MGLDFRKLEKVAQEAVADFDHAYLNDLEPFKNEHPTAERLARVVYDRAAARLANITPTSKLVEVEAWEMSNYRVTYRPA
jgi:6-pyruvoyltetrahydropterin/6-carboxytetrahydropterin synthase